MVESVGGDALIVVDRTVVEIGVGALVWIVVGTVLGTKVGRVCGGALDVVDGTVVELVEGRVVWTVVGTEVGRVAESARVRVLGVVDRTVVKIVVGTVVGTLVGIVVRTAVGTFVGTETGIVVESVSRGALVVSVMPGKDFGIVLGRVVGTVVEKVVSTLTEEPSTVRGLTLTVGVGCEGGGGVLGDGTIVVETTRERLLTVIGGVGGRGVILVV